MRNMDNRYKFVKLIVKCEVNGCALESEIRKQWKACPGHLELLNLGNGELFTSNMDFDNPGFSITNQGLEYIRNRERSNLNLAISIATFIVAVATLFVTAG